MEEETLVEECVTCEGSGTVEAKLGLLAICPRCDGACYVEHRCSQEGE